MIKSKIKVTGHFILRSTKKAIAVNPKLKKRLKATILDYVYLNESKDAYSLWLENNFPDSIALEEAKEEAKRFSYNPKISILIPTYNTPINFLKECIYSVIAQSYDNWELCIVDDHSTEANVRELINEYANKDQRIKYTFNKKNMHISGASNTAAKMATGEFLVLLDHDDILWPNAIHELVKALNKDKKLDFIYSDEDKITENRNHHALPFFKPDWNFEFLRSVNYITHLAVIRKSIFEKVGGFTDNFNGAQDWDLFLRVSQVTSNIYHIPTVLYSWRISETSTAGNTDAKPYVVQAQKTALEQDLKSRGLKGKVETNSFIKDYWSIRYDVIDEPLVSIVIPTKNQYKIIKTCIESILNKTTYKNYEIVIVDTGSTDKRVNSFYNRILKDERVRKIDWIEKFSYARSCNEGARVAKGKFLVMLNNDTEVVTPDWIERFLGYAQQSEIGAVGAKLYYPGQKLIQHAGVGLGLGGYAANLLATANWRHLTPQQNLYLSTIHNLSAVTAACLMIEKSKFQDVSGFSEEFSVTYNDVDLCLKLCEKKYRNVYLPEVEFIHYESITLGRPEEIKKRDTKEFEEAKKLLKKRWNKYILHDPALNPNLTKDDASLETLTYS